ncbi:MAG TPA: glycosyl transferase, partial [Blastocatellia bacterium]|nr:glycosyl transferase [Blastocatellia bacterium]
MPPAAVIVPCRGLDEGFRENLRSLIEQDYPAYQLICVVDSRADPAYGEIGRVVSETGALHVHVVEAGRARGRGQKVHNLLAGLDY